MMKKIFTILSVLTIGVSAEAQVVINEVFPTGGNSGAAFKQDFVELYNKGTAPVTLTNAYLQYAGATSTMTAYELPTSITLSPGQYYLIQCYGGTNGTVNLVSPDATFSTLNMAATAGKVALTSDNVLVTSSSQSNVIDLVGWGSTASLFEGAVAPVPSVTASISRTNGVDTNNNSVDFMTTSPTPINSSNQSTLGTNENMKSKINLLKNIVVSDVLEFNSKAIIKLMNMNGQVLKTAAVDVGNSLDISFLPKGIYLISGQVNGEKFSQKIIKNN